MSVIAALVIVAWVQWSGTPWRDMGFARPASWIWVVAAGVTLGVVLKLALKAIVLPLLRAPATNAAYQSLVGNTPMLVWMVVVSVLVAGLAEEIVWRAFLFDRLHVSLGWTTAATGSIVLITAVAFALAHYPDQGIPGVQQALVTGLVFGAVFAATSSIWPVVIAHAAFDVTAVLIIYAGLEETVAHAFFR